ncbi:MAG TPA: M48 family metallopeptidase [Candidatus Angelobacter sp.]|nr:M48 family metallopeptidase [Candidatus Angelobacter sp.]
MSFFKFMAEWGIWDIFQTVVTIVGGLVVLFYLFPRRLLIVVFLCVVASTVFAQTETPQLQPSEAKVDSSPAQSYTLSPDKYEKAVAFSRAKYQLYFVDTAYGILILILLLNLRVAPKYRDWAERISHRRFVQAWIFASLFLLTAAVLGLPTEIYRQWLSRKYEQSIQGWGSWSWDWAKAELVALIFGAIVIWILYAIIRRSPRRWWLYFWLVSIPLVILLVFIQPLVIEPLFFKFEPLQNKHPELVADISKVVARGGLMIPPDRMFEMKASEKLKSLDAYVTGIGASKRVVVWDNTMKRLTNEQTLFVFGHEMGHYVLHHIPQLIAWIVALLLVFLYIGNRGMHWALQRWGPRWHIRGLEDWASFPVLLLWLSILIFIVTPIGNTISRHYEHEADIYGLEVIHGIVPRPADPAVPAFQTLGEVNLSDPKPSRLIELWLYNHPPLNKRIEFAQTYDPWSKGHPQFVK